MTVETPAVVLDAAEGSRRLKATRDGQTAMRGPWALSVEVPDNRSRIPAIDAEAGALLTETLRAWSAAAAMGADTPLQHHRSFGLIVFGASPGLALTAGWIARTAWSVWRDVEAWDSSGG